MKHRISTAMLAATATVLIAGTVAADPPSDDVERGAYLVRIMACNDCHTPFVLGTNGPTPDTTRFLSGHPAGERLPAPPSELGSGPWVWAGAGSNTAYAGPWGVSFAANLTPDDETGLGSWSKEMFVNAIRTGRHMGVGRPILPPMPSQAYAGATDEDLEAIFTYLRTIAPIRNAVPQPIEPAVGH
jgi:hypothetical protein